jgi:hypothetical protein
MPRAVPVLGARLEASIEGGFAARLHRDSKILLKQQDRHTRPPHKRLRFNRFGNHAKPGRRKPGVISSIANILPASKIDDDRTVL